MARAVTLADFRPSPRADGEAWTKARIEKADAFEGTWEEVKAVDLDPVDKDPTEPALRSFTIGADKEWLRIVFLDGEGNEDEPSPPVATSGHPFRPPVAQVSAILRARTYTDADESVVGGELSGEFSADTTPTAEQVENDLIPQSCTDLIRAVGHVPGVYLGDARRVVALGVVAEIERSYIPEQAEPDGTIFQTLRKTHAEESLSLRIALQWWAVTQRLESA
jgi:hypothetical protein